MGRRAWSLRLRRGLWPSLGGPLRRAWVATDPNGTLRALEEIRRLMVPASAPARPSAGAEARFTGPLSVRSWRGDARLGDDDLADWLIRELGGDPGERRAYPSSSSSGCSQTTRAATWSGGACTKKGADRGRCSGGG